MDIESRIYWAEYFLYLLWCKLRGKPYPHGETETQPGKCYLVTKGLPDVFLPFRGRAIRLWVPIVFEVIETNCPGPGDQTRRVFECAFQCERCGLDLKKLKRQTKEEAQRIEGN